MVRMREPCIRFASVRWAVSGKRAATASNAAVFLQLGARSSGRTESPQCRTCASKAAEEEDQAKVLELLGDMAELEDKMSQFEDDMAEYEDEIERTQDDLSPETRRILENADCL